MYKGEGGGRFCCRFYFIYESNFLVSLVFVSVPHYSYKTYNVEPISLDPLLTVSQVYFSFELSGTVVSTLLNFVRMFGRAHEENCKQLELEKKKALKDAEMEKKTSTPKKDPEKVLQSPIRSSTLK